MEVLIDTNVILNYSTQRNDDFLDASNEVTKLCAMEKIYDIVTIKEETSRTLES